MMSLIKRLVGKGTRQDMEYMEKSVYNAPAIAQNTVTWVAKKVEDNVMRVMTTPIIALQSATLQDPAANPPHALLKVHNAIVFKKVHMPMGKLKATKPWPELAKAQAQR